MLTKVRHLLEMIKFSHTLFAFPFALLGAVLAAVESGAPPTPAQLLWICLAMVGARTAAMTFNRLIDARIDALNPRTAQRHLPAGKVTVGEAVLFLIGSVALLMMAAWQLNPLCFLLAPLALALFVLYAYCKRFTHLAHLVLGLCLAGAPVGAWIALRGDLQWPAVALGLAVLFWVAGFDIFYALQDLEFDRSAGLYSIPARLGEARAIAVARLCHWLMLVFLVLVALGSALGLIYLSGVALTAGLLVYEHRLIRPGDHARLDAAFFNMNGIISVTLFLFALADALLLWRAAGA